MTYTILGNPPSKANNYKIGRGKMYKDKSVTQYENDFTKQCREKNRMVSKKFSFAAVVFFRDSRSDLDNFCKVFLDCLQKNRVIKNDNLCMGIALFKEVDKKNPRVNYSITELP